MAELPHPALAELADIAQWTSWQKDTKVPLKPKTLKPYAKGENVLPHLTTLASVRGLLIGFYALENDPWVLLDLDKVRDPETGKILDWAMALVRLLDSYTEISPSGTGLHIIIRCSDKPREGYVIQKYGGAKIEVRVNTQYITIATQTSKVIHGTGIKEHPREIFDHPLFMESVERKGNGATQILGNGAARAQGTLDIVVSAERGISARDLRLIQENHPDLWQVWNKKATPARDATHSGYMASLARRFANMGKDDQWIADALVEFCDRHRRPDCVDRRQIERCILLARSDPGYVDEKPEVLQAAVEALAQDDAIESAEDQRAEALKILSAHFRMPISDVRRFGKHPGRVQLCNCEEWLDVGQPKDVLRQTAVIEAIFHAKALVVPRVKPERWARIATLIGQNWRVEDAGDEEWCTALEELIEGRIRAGQKPTAETIMEMRKQRKCHEWEGKRYVFASALASDAKFMDIPGLRQRLRDLGYEPKTVFAGDTSRSAWICDISSPLYARERVE